MNENGKLQLTNPYIGWPWWEIFTKQSQNGHWANKAETGYPNTGFRLSGLSSQCINMADANNKTNMIEMTIITLPSRFCGNGSMGKLISLVISLVNRRTYLRCNHDSATKSGKHAIRQARNQASTKSSRLRLIISDRRAKIIQFTATKPANLIQFF